MGEARADAPTRQAIASHLRTPDAYKTMNLFFHVFLFSPRLVTNPECTHVVSSAAAIAAIEGPGCALLQTAQCTCTISQFGRLETQRPAVGLFQCLVDHAHQKILYCCATMPTVHPLIKGDCAGNPLHKQASVPSCKNNAFGLRPQVNETVRVSHEFH